MAVLIASDLAKDMAGEPLLRGVSFRLERRDRMTLSGRNGAGKTTLLRMLSGETSVDGGELSFAKDVRIALHDQRPPRDRDLSLRDYVLSGAKDLLDLETRLGELEQAMAEGATDAATLDAYARAQARLEHAGGYNWRESINATLHGLGFRDEHLDRSLETFSGGELTRASLARALAGDPDLLLLDEPTNHLDIESLEWLESHLQSLDAAVVLVAHDRWFLEAVGTAVLELEAGRGRFFKGTWHAWRKEKASRELALGRAIEKQEAEIARLERFVDRFRAGTRARQAQARVKKLEKIERLERDPRDGKALGFAFKPPERSGRVVFEVERGELAIGERTLLHDFELWLERGEHVSLIGPNGTGKTTLIKRPGRPARAAGRQAAARPQRQARAALPARRGARRARRPHGARGGPARDRPQAERGALAAGPLPVQRRGGREAARRAVGRRAAPALAGHPRPLRRQRARARRAHQPPRPREPRGARGGAPGLPRLAAADLPRPRAARRGGKPHGGVEDGTLHSYVGGWPEYLRVREERKELERTAKRSKPPREPAPEARRGRRRTSSAAPASWRRRSRPPRPSCRRSRPSSPTRRPGTTRAARRSRRAATTRPSRPCRRSTRSGRQWLDSPTATTRSRGRSACASAGRWRRA